MAPDVDHYIKRFQKGKERDQNWHGAWQELALYFKPRAAKVFFMGGNTAGISVNKQPEGTGGITLTSKLFDSAPMQAAHILSSSIHGSLTSDAYKWFRIVTRRQDLNDNKNVAEWLDECTDRMYLALTQSNFSSEIAEVYEDLVVFATGSMLIVEDDPSSAYFSGLRFQANGIGTYTIFEDAKGNVNGQFTAYYMSALAAYAQWGENIGEKLMKVYTDKPDSMVEIVHFAGPREDYENPGRTLGMAGRAKPWKSVYFTVEGKHIISEGGFDDFPYAVARWSKTSGEVWGRGPGWVALPDTKTLNQAVYMTLKAWAKAIDPPLMVTHNGVIGSVKLHSGGVTIVRDVDKIKPLPNGTNFQIDQIKSDNLRASIRDTFYNQQLQLPNGPQMTATEVERRMELMQRFLGPTVGRIQRELLSKTLIRVFHIMLRRGALPPVPPELQGNGKLDIEYQGPLARAQRATDVQAIERTIQGVLPLAEHEPSVLDILDLDVAARIIAQRNEVPPQIIRDPTAIMQRRQQRQQMQQMQQMGEAGKGVAPLLKAIAPKGLAELQQQT